MIGTGQIDELTYGETHIVLDLDPYMLDLPDFHRQHLIRHLQAGGSLFMPMTRIAVEITQPTPAQGGSEHAAESIGRSVGGS